MSQPASVPSPAIPPRPSGLWPVLGGVRFGLAMIVFFGHLPVFVAVPSWLDHLRLLSAPTAVICFLVVSGYSIAHSIERNARHFYRRRWLRIYPLYVVSLAVAVAVEFLPGAVYPLVPFDLVGSLLFLDTFVTKPIPAHGVVWSLAVEVACYALTPIFQRLGSASLLALVGVSGLAFAAYPHLHLEYYAALPCGGALFFLGWAWLSGFLYYRHRHARHAGLSLLAWMVVLANANSAHTERYQYVTIVAATGLLACGNSFRLGVGLAGALSYVGDLSYPLYLIHGPIMLLCRDTLRWRSWPLVLGLSLAAAALGLLVDLRLRGPFAALLIRVEAAVSRVTGGPRPDPAPALGNPGQDLPSAR